MSSPVKNYPLGTEDPMASVEAINLGSCRGKGKSCGLQVRTAETWIFHDFSWRLLRLFFKGDVLKSMLFLRNEINAYRSLCRDIPWESLHWLVGSLI